MKVQDLNSNCKKIERNGSNVNLKFNVTSLVQDKRLKFRNRDIQLFDDHGNEIEPSGLVLGSHSHSYSIDYNMVHGVSVPLEISFTNMSSSAESISLFRFGFSDSKRKQCF